MNELILKTFEYEGSPITFQTGNGVMVNATQMAKRWGTKPADWLRTEQAQRIIEAVSVSQKCDTADLVQVKQGGTNQGTWLHEDLALVFAQWLSPELYLWCNDRIKELLTTGVATISNDDEAILQAMTILQKRVEESRQRVQMLEGTVEAQENEIKRLAPAADYTHQVLQSTSTFTLTELAKDMGFRSVHELTKWAVAHGILYRQSDRWLPTAKYSGKGYFSTRTCKYVKSDNSIGTSLSTVVTERGRAFLHLFLSDCQKKQQQVNTTEQ